MASIQPTSSSSPSSAQQPTNQGEQITPLDRGIMLAVHTWPVMTLAVTSNWGGPESSDKRDWLCGAISDMLQERPETDAEDLEDVLIQVMNDEFDVVVDDDSAAGVGVMIMRFKEQLQRGDDREVDELWMDWQEKRRRRGGNSNNAPMFKNVDADDQDQETSADEDEDEDVKMDDAPDLVVASSSTAGPRARVEPEVDEEGFTKVVSKKRR